MICALVDNLLDLHMDGRLVAFQARLVERHLAACPRCAARLASLEKVRRGLRDLAAPVPPADFGAALKAALLDRENRVGAADEPVYESTEPVPAFSLAFSLAAFLLFASGSILGPGLPSQSCSDGATSVCAGNGAAKGE
ncbi:MAG: zf-HC2 domain-containing protein [Elusimicrobiales bacterium]|nr:zf-HC2 domain-containing protein [Elusimicrobiales bacterium]